MVTLVANIYKADLLRMRRFEDMVIVRVIEREIQEAFPEYQKPKKTINQ